MKSKLKRLWYLITRRETVKESLKFVPDENFHGQSTSYFVSDNCKYLIDDYLNGN